MTALGKWLQQELQDRDLTQQAAATYAGVSMATVSDILRRDHIPSMEILFRLADYFDTPREHVLRLAARMPVEPGEPDQDDDFLVQELLEEFRKVPDDWKEAIIEQVAWLRRLAERPPTGRPPAHIIGGEEEDEEERKTESKTA